MERRARRIRCWRQRSRLRLPFAVVHVLAIPIVSSRLSSEDSWRYISRSALIRLHSLFLAIGADSHGFFYFAPSAAFPFFFASSSAVLDVACSVAVAFRYSSSLTSGVYIYSPRRRFQASGPWKTSWGWQKRWPDVRRGLVSDEDQVLLAACFFAEFGSVNAPRIGRKKSWK